MAWKSKIPPKPIVKMIDLEHAEIIREDWRGRIKRRILITTAYDEEGKIEKRSILLRNFKKKELMKSLMDIPWLQESNNIEIEDNGTQLIIRDGTGKLIEIEGIHKELEKDGITI